MKILCLSATKLEIAPILEKFSEDLSTEDGGFILSYNSHKVKFIITGIGSVPTTYHLTRELARSKYDIVLNLGICGSFIDEISLGEVVYVEEEIFADLGVETEEGFKTIFEAGLAEKDMRPYSNGKLINKSRINEKVFGNLKRVNGLTVNKSTGSVVEAEHLKLKFKADIESMEGAAVFYTCLLESVPFVEIRSVSNKVGVTDKAGWNIPLATKNLADVVIGYFEKTVKP